MQCWTRISEFYTGTVAAVLPALYENLFAPSRNIHRIVLCSKELFSPLDNECHYELVPKEIILFVSFLGIVLQETIYLFAFSACSQACNFSSIRFHGESRRYHDGRGSLLNGREGEGLTQPASFRECHFLFLFWACKKSESTAAKEKCTSEPDKLRKWGWRFVLHETITFYLI